MDYSLLVGIHNLDAATKKNTASPPADKIDTPQEKSVPSPTDAPTTPSSGQISYFSKQLF